MGHRIKYVGQIINRIVKALTYGKEVSDFELELGTAAPKEQFKICLERKVCGREGLQLCEIGARFIQEKGGVHRCSERDRKSVV